MLSRLSKRPVSVTGFITNRPLSTFDNTVPRVLQNLDNSSKFNFGVQIVPKDEVRIVENFSGARRTLEGGFHFLSPITSTVAYTHSLKERMLPIKTCNVLTSDSVNISIKGNIISKVTCPEKLSYNVSNPYSNLYKMVHSAIRVEVSDISLEDITKSQYIFNHRIKEIIEPRIENWGLSMSYGIEEIIPCKDYLKTIENENRLKADLKKSETKDKYERRSVEMMSEILVKNIKEKAKAEAFSLKTVSDAKASAIKTRNRADLEKAKSELRAFKILNANEDAAKFALAKEMTEAWKILAANGPTVLMSGNPSDISTAVAKALATYDAVKKI